MGVLLRNSPVILHNKRPFAGKDVDDYACHLCKMVFARIDDKRRHIREHHEHENQVTCAFCGRIILIRSVRRHCRHHCPKAKQALDFFKAGGIFIIQPHPIAKEECNFKLKKCEGNYTAIPA